MIGPEGTPYSNGYFRLTIDFTEDPPEKPPEIKFLTKIFHLNINDIGHIWLKSYNGFVEGYNFEQVFYEIYFLFIKQNPDSTWCKFNDRKDLYVNNREEFNRIATEWTKKYATEEESNKIYD